MNKEHKKHLLELYEQGLSNKEEEKVLLNDYAKTEDIWFDYLHKHKKEAPANLESRVWDSIQAKQNGRRRILLSAISVAASILIAVLLFVYSSRPIAGEMSYQEKEAGLKEALALTDNTENLQYGIEIIYEDESIVIYTK